MTGKIIYWRTTDWLRTWVFIQAT